MIKLFRTIFSICVITVIWMLPFQTAFSQDFISMRQKGKSADVQGINNVILKNQEPSSGFSFLVMGHIYGSYGSAPHVWDRSYLSPALPLLHTLKNFDQSDVNFVISLGDIVNDWSEEDLYVLDKVFLDKFDIPVFNAVGNHDVIQGQEVYQRRFGPTSQFYLYGNSLFIILDSQHLNFEVFLAGINKAKKNPAIRNIFIAMHQPLFLAKDPKFLPVLSNTNARTIFKNDNQFMVQFYPKLESLSREKQIFLMAGDIGVDAEWSYSIFYHREGNIHFLANGLGDTANDAILHVISNSEGVKIIPISLLGKKMHAIDHYGIKFWKAYFSPIGAIYRKVTKNKKYLLVGFITGVFTLGLLLILLSIRKIYCQKDLKIANRSNSSSDDLLHRKRFLRN